MKEECSLNRQLCGCESPCSSGGGGVLGWVREVERRSERVERPQRSLSEVEAEVEAAGVGAVPEMEGVAAMPTQPTCSPDH